MTKTLTEQWRGVKLPQSCYYIKNQDDEEHIAYDVGLNDIMFDGKFVFVQEVLAPVPSYDEFKRLQEQIKELKYYRDRAHKALCEISSLSEKEMDSGKAWDIAHNAILCLNEIKE